MSDDAGQTDAGTVPLTFGVPDEAWLADRLEETRYDTVDDFVVETLDKTIFALERREELDASDELTVEIPQDVYERLSEALEQQNTRPETSVEELLEETLTSTYIISREGP